MSSEEVLEDVENVEDVEDVENVEDVEDVEWKKWRKGVQLLKTRRAEREMEAIQEILGDIEIEEDDGEMNHAEEEDNNYDSDASIF
ncbi:unnamed protein product [Caenorhabditis nigoni]